MFVKKYRIKRFFSEPCVTHKKLRVHVYKRRMVLVFLFFFFPRTIFILVIWIFISKWMKAQCFCSSWSFCCLLHVVALNFRVSCCGAVTCFDRLLILSSVGRQKHRFLSVSYTLFHILWTLIFYFISFVSSESQTVFLFLFFLEWLFCLYCYLSLNFSVGSIYFLMGVVHQYFGSM